MWVENFVDNWIDTLKKIYNDWKEVMKNDKLTFLQFFAKALKDTTIWAYYVFLKSEIDWIIKKNEVQSTINDTSNKVAYLIGWYYLNPSSLLKLKSSLEKEWVCVKIINERYYSKESLWNLVRELKTKIREDKYKDVVLFWYSAWWIIAHKVWEKSWYKSVSFWVSNEPSKTMVWTLLSLTKKDEISDINIPKNWINLEESFSAMVPNVWDWKENTIRLDNVYSHMTIWREDVVNEITKHILLWYNTIRV